MSCLFCVGRSNKWQRVFQSGAEDKQIFQDTRTQIPCFNRLENPLDDERQIFWGQTRQMFWGQTKATCILAISKLTIRYQNLNCIFIMKLNISPWHHNFYQIVIDNTFQEQVFIETYIPQFHNWVISLIFECIEWDSLQRLTHAVGWDNESDNSV